MTILFAPKAVINCPLDDPSTAHAKAVSMPLSCRTRPCQSPHARRPNMSFDLNLTRLERQYKLLQWHLHPDKVVGRPVDEQQFAAQQATLINHAYSVLKAPLSRANYIVSPMNIVCAGDLGFPVPMGLQRHYACWAVPTGMLRSLQQGGAGAVGTCFPGSLSLTAVTAFLQLALPTPPQLHGLSLTARLFSHMPCMQLSLKGHDMGEGSTVADPELLMEVGGAAAHVFHCLSGVARGSVEQLSHKGSRKAVLGRTGGPAACCVPTCLCLLCAPVHRCWKHGSRWRVRMTPRS